MAGTPKYKIYNPAKEYIGSCKYAEDAGALAVLQGDGATVKDEWHKKILWTCGANRFDSYDIIAAEIHEAEQERRKCDALQVVRVTGNREKLS